MENAFCVPSAVIVLLIKEVDGRKFVLCQRRKNTGFADGKLDFSCGGKVEKGETMTAAAIREAKEELGIVIDKSDLRFVCLVHKCDAPCDLILYNGYFIAEKFEGEPAVCEPQKCAEIGWYDIEKLPSDLIDDRKEVIKEVRKGNSYLEYGWE